MGERLRRRVTSTLTVATCDTFNEDNKAMKNYVHIKDPKRRQIAMLLDHLAHLEALGDYADVQAHIAQTKRELASVTGVSLIEEWK